MKRALVAGAVLAAAAAAALFFFPARIFGRRVEPMVTASGRALTGFCAAAVRLHCDKRVECGQMDRAQLAACLSQAGAECERSVGWKLRQGVLSTSGEPQEECFEAMAEAGCNALQFMLGDDEPSIFEITSRCELGELFQPHSTLSAPCAETSDCTAGFCPGLATECHRCRPYLSAGAPCKPGEQVCDPKKAFCVAVAGGAMECRALAPDGAACKGWQDCLSGACSGHACVAGALGNRCAAAEDCAPAFYCRGGTCAPRAKTGEACSSEPRACAEPEARCVLDKCLVRPFLIAAGKECREFTDCQDGLYCQGTRGGAAIGQCAAQGSAGGPCAPLDYGACRSGTTCLNGRCFRLRGAGEKCSGSYQCKAFLSCVPNSIDKGFTSGGTCVADAAAGQACHKYLRCVDGDCADSGKCVALAAGGVPCANSQQCDSHWCAGQPGSSVCYAPCK